MHESFNPTSNLILTIGDVQYRPDPHPYLSDDVYVLEGGEALVYRLRDLNTGEGMALKCFKQTLRGSYLADNTQRMTSLVGVPGLALARRICLTRKAYPRLIKEYPDLEFSILMPWVEGISWAGILQNRTYPYPRWAALRLARETARVLYELEMRRLVHSDISGANIVIATTNPPAIELIDIDHLFLPERRQPLIVGRGTPGYIHPTHATEKVISDRFAGAIVVSEMLAWANPHVRDIIPEGAETCCMQSEIGKESVVFAAIQETLATYSTAIGALFTQAWYSTSSETCPDLGSWVLALAGAEE